MTFEEALRTLGVRDDTLTEAEKETLARDGFLRLDGIMTPEYVAKAGARLDELTRIEGADAGRETHFETGSDRLSDLVNKDAMFDITFTHPRVLAAIRQVIRGAFKFSSLNSRAALPGQGNQHLHADWDEEPVEPGDYYVCNSIWLLDDFTEHNGATRVVPGSHRSGKLPRDEMDDPGAPHPREIQLIAPAGTVFIFNSHCWHGGTQNNTPNRRRAMHAYYCRRDQPQQTNQRDYIRPETYARLSEAARYILDV